MNDNNDPGSQEPLDQNPAAEGLGAQKILVIEDEKRNQIILRDHLESQGFVVDLADSGERGLTMLEQTDYDLVLLDIMMPGMNGFEVLKRAKKKDDINDTPIIVISALEGSENAAEAIKLGAEDFLPKPFKRVILNARINACIERFHLRKRERQQLGIIQQNYEQLKLTEKARDNLARMIVHDLNGPLSVVTGYADLICSEIDHQSDEATRQDIKNFAGQVGVAARRMASLTASILDVSRIEDESMKVSWTNIDLNTVAGNLIEQYEAYAKERGLTLQLELSSSSPVILGDTFLLNRIVENLFSNCLKYASNHILVRVTQKRAQFYLLEFVNDGQVIPASDRERVFDKYFQCDRSDGGEKRYGVGLGLTFSSLATNAMDGRIWMDDGSDGNTHFYVEFKEADT